MSALATAIRRTIKSAANGARGRDYVGYGFYREHAWHTWDRLRASPATTAEIIAGRIGSITLAMLQFVVVFGVGSLLMGLRVRGSWTNVGLIGIAFGLFVVSVGLAVAAVCRTVIQANTIAYLGTLALAGLGGALVPVALLPNWAQAVAPAVPSWWAMRGYRSAILDNGDSVVLSAAVLVSGALALSVFAVWRMRFEEAKAGFA